MFEITGAKLVEVVKDCKFNSDDKLSRLRNEPICVISVIGSSEYHEDIGKGACKRAFQLVLDTFGSPYVFSEPTFQENRNAKTSAWGYKRQLGCIDGFYTEDGKILFLHLQGMEDPRTLADEWQKAVKEVQGNALGFNEIWGRIKTKYLRSLLLLFSMSHVVLVSCKETYFDTNYIQLFRALNSLRVEVLPHVTKLLARIDGVNRSWKEHGRLCSPRILFLFKMKTDRPKLVAEDLMRSGAVKKEQYKLEEEIYQILRKCRVVTNISANSLFAVPSTQEYVFVFDEGVREPEMCDDIATSIGHLTIKFCEQACAKLLDPDNTDSDASDVEFSSMFPSFSNANASKPRHEQLKTYKHVTSDFKDFIMAHVRLAHGVGFDDDSRRVAEHKHFFVKPTFKTWKKVFDVLYNYFVMDHHPEEKALDAIGQAYRLSTIDIEFLESQCGKLLPKMYTLYLKNMPETYSEKLHKAKVAHVVEAFMKQANGPEVRPYIEELIEKCNKYWETGRQQCDVRSLLEHTCSHAKHRVAVEDHLEVIPMLEMDESLPEKPHCTGHRLISFCNCGHKQGTRDEPFSIREANFEFYERIKHGCCDILEQISFPSYVLPVGKQMIHPQEMLLIYQQKYVEFVNNQGKFDLFTDNHEDELRQELSMEFEEDSENDENQPGKIDPEPIHPDEPEKPIAIIQPQLRSSSSTDGLLPKSEFENELLYERLRREALQTEEEPTSKSAVVEIVRAPDLQGRKQISDLIKEIKQEVREAEKKRKELCKKDIELPKEPVDPRNIRRRVYDQLDATLKLVALKLQHTDEWATWSRQFPSDIVDWVKENSDRTSSDLQQEIVGLQQLQLDDHHGAFIPEDIDHELEQFCQMLKAKAAAEEAEKIEEAVEEPEQVSQEVQKIKITDKSLLYLPGMLHTRSLPTLLPLYSSWSLVCVGSSSLYTHNVGITHQPGFISSSSTLLPWDKMVKAEAGVGVYKPVPRLIRGRRPTGRARRIMDEFTVKIFIGVEYECKRGHRFMLESPERILYVHNHPGKNLKELSKNIVDADMPLYFRCPCSKDGRDVAPTIAQLMRLHVITPKAPVHTTLNPRIQPAPLPCPIFHPGNAEPVKLTPSSYWILRLPYCYVSDDQVYVPSKDVARYNGKLLRGVFDVESMNREETIRWETDQL